MTLSKVGLVFASVAAKFVLADDVSDATTIVHEELHRRSWSLENTFLKGQSTDKYQACHQALVRIAKSKLGGFRHKQEPKDARERTVAYMRNVMEFLGGNSRCTYPEKAVLWPTKDAKISIEDLVKLCYGLNQKHRSDLLEDGKLKESELKAFMKSQEAVWKHHELNKYLPTNSSFGFFHFLFLVIIIVLIIVLVWYFFFRKADEEKGEEVAEP